VTGAARPGDARAGDAPADDVLAAIVAAAAVLLARTAASAKNNVSSGSRWALAGRLSRVDRDVVRRVAGARSRWTGSGVPRG
jgi:hypothetical protein